MLDDNILVRGGGIWIWSERSCYILDEYKFSDSHFGRSGRFGRFVAVGKCDDKKYLI
ncbi:MAG: hypothetical protein IID09_07075 [Candidatus Hydrogenedentes bacterium]|nr:hypothetical protein [Candidatus Hydrogenedentota bacterium]